MVYGDHILSSHPLSLMNRDHCWALSLVLSLLSLPLCSVALDKHCILFPLNPFRLTVSLALSLLLSPSLALVLSRSATQRSSALHEQSPLYLYIAPTAFACKDLKERTKAVFNVAVEMQIEITSSPELFVCTAYYYIYYIIKRVGLLWESVWRRAGLSRLPWTSLIGRWCWGRPMRAQVNPDTSTHTLGVLLDGTPTPGRVSSPTDLLQQTATLVSNITFSWVTLTFVW